MLGSTRCSRSFNTDYVRFNKGVYHKSLHSHNFDASKMAIEDDEYHAYLIISLESRTMVLETADLLGKVTKTIDYYVQGSTMAAGRLFGRLLSLPEDNVAQFRTLEQERRINNGWDVHSNKDETLYQKADCADLKVDSRCELFEVIVRCFLVG